MSDEDLIDEEERESEPVDPVCPACGLANIHRRPRALYFFVVAAIAVSFGVAGGQTEAAFLFVAAAAIFSVISDRWVCTDCGETWK